MKQGGKTAVKEENNTEKKEFPKDIDYVNPYVGLDKIYEKDPYKNLADGSKKKKTKQPAENRKKTEKADGYLA